jgi:hypothetical protein
VAFNFGGLVLFKPSRKKGDDWSMRSGKMHTWRKRAWWRIFEEFGSLEKLGQGRIEEMACIPIDDDRQLMIQAKGRVIEVETNLKRYLEGEEQPVVRNVEV